MTNKTINFHSTVKNSILNMPREHGIKRFDEERLIRNFIKSTGLDSSAKILDIGCGFGEKMEWMVKDGYIPHGVDINSDTIEATQHKGFHCMTPNEFKKTNDMYDILLMIHIIEHFHPSDLLNFFEGYLDRLKTGGYLLIATPLEWNDFFSDFDHIKVYQPNSIIQMFREETQVQYHSKHHIKMVGFGLRRQPWNTPAHEDYYCKFNKADFLWRFSRSLISRLSRYVFQYSGGSLGGITTGWVGMFQKEA